MSTFKNLQTKYKVIIVISAIVLLGFFFCQTYYDMGITTYHGISFWDCLFSGNIRNFYSINNNATLVFSNTMSGEYSAAYDFIIYIIFAIWDFPLWIAKTYLGIEYPVATFLGTCWAKSISLFFFILSALFFNKIAKMLNNDDSFVFKCTLGFVTSLYAIDYVFVMGQYDSIAICFMLAGLYCYMKEKKWIGLAMFAVAIPTKMFALFALVIILLYMEKNILKILGNLVLALLPMIICRVLIPFADANNVNSFFNFIFFSNPWSMGIGDFSVFLVLFIILCVAVYVFVKKEDSHRRLIFLLFGVYALFGVCAYNFPYWLLYFVPFMYLTFCANREIFELNICLDAVGAFFVIIAQILTFDWTYSSSLASNLLVSKIFPREDKGITINVFLNSILGEAKYNQIISIAVTLCLSVFLACMLMIMILNYRNINRPFSIQEEVRINLRWFGLALRIVLSLIVLTMPVLFYLI